MQDSNLYVSYVNILWRPVLNQFFEYWRTKPLTQVLGYRASVRQGFLRHGCKAGRLSQEILHAMKLFGI